MPNEDNNMIEMPKQPRKSGLKRGRVLVWIFIFSAMAAAAALWTLRDVLVRDAVPPRSANQTGTDAALQPLPGPPPGLSAMLGGENATQPLADALPGANGTVPAANATNATQAGMPEGPQDDAIVRFAFIEDLAPWMVKQYHPRGSHPEARKSGVVLAEASQANQRYGMNMTGLSWTGDNVAAGRAAVLDYAFTPPMLDSLYRLYVDRLMQGVAAAAAAPRADGKVLSPEEVKEMYRLYAQRMRSIAGAFEGIAAMKDLPRRVGAWHEASDSAADANASFMEVLHTYETARDAGNTQQAEQARKLMELSGKSYQQAIVMRERARESLAEAIRKQPDARRLDDGTLVYLATWASRRVDKQPERMDAVRMVSTLLTDLAGRFERAAGN